MSTATISVDEFQALEQKVLRAVEIVKREREARTKAEAEVTTLTKDRDSVRLRVEKMLQQMDDLL